MDICIRCFDCGARQALNKVVGQRFDWLCRLHTLDPNRVPFKDNEIEGRYRTIDQLCEDIYALAPDSDRVHQIIEGLIIEAEMTVEDKLPENYGLGNETRFPKPSILIVEGEDYLTDEEYEKLEYESALEWMDTTIKYLSAYLEALRWALDLLE